MSQSDACPCGGTKVFDTSIIYTVHPPKFRWNCPKCGAVGYCDTTELPKPNILEELLTLLEKDPALRARLRLLLARDE